MGAKKESVQHRGTVPASMRHKRILDVAANRPEATAEAIADEVPSATKDLVETVLEEYGDPAAKEEELAVDEVDPVETDSGLQSNEETVQEDLEIPDKSEITEKQIEALRAIHERPEATQRELASILGVSGASVSNRVNSIPGFEWSERQAFAEQVVEDGVAEKEGESPIMDSKRNEQQATVNELTNRVISLERRLGTMSRSETGDVFFDDPELAHKVMHACLKSNTLTEEEELRVVKILLG